MSLTKGYSYVSFLASPKKLAQGGIVNIWFALVFLQIMDVTTTLIFLSLGLKEAHPLFRWTISQFGPIWGLFWKLPAVLVLVALGFFFQKKRNRFNLTKVINWVNVLFAFVVLWNTVAIAAKLYGSQ